MARILIWMSPEPGHILPTIKVARDLGSMGHQVTYLTCGAILHELMALGLQTIPFLPEDADLLGSRSVFTACGPARFAYQALRGRYATDDAYVSAIRKAIRAAALQVNADLTLVDGILDSLLRLETRRVLSDISEVARLYIHLPYRKPSEEEISGAFGPLIFLSPPEFELPELLLPEAHYTEASVFQGPYPASLSVDLATLAHGKPIVYCSLGTQSTLYDGMPSWLSQILQTADGLPQYHFIVNVGAADGGDRLGSIPANVSVMRFVNQMQVLMRACAVITNGGFGTVKEAIYSAVPMIVCPQQWDQPWNARRIRRHRIGVECSGEDLSPTRIRQALHLLVDGKAASAQIGNMQRVFHAVEKQSRTAVLCAEILNGRAARVQEHANADGD